MPKYLVLGGCGFIGRNLVCRLCCLDDCEKLIVYDKRRPEISWLTPLQKESFNNPKVLFRQINLFNEENVLSFLSENPCDYIINVAADTKLKQIPEFYEKNIFDIGAIAARAAIKTNAKKFIQISSARIKVLDVCKNLNKRKDSVTDILECQKKLEDYLGTLDCLNFIIIRTALVYGLGDINVPILTTMGLYKCLKEKLKILWTPNICIETVHVEDVVSACLHAINIEENHKIYELADKSHSTQGSIINAASLIFGVSYRFLGNLENALAKTILEDIVDDINQKHMLAWSKACQKEGITVTPIDPFFTEEQLILDDFTVSSAEFEKTGFVLKFPELLPEELRKIVNQYVNQKLFPKICAPNDHCKS